MWQKLLRRLRYWREQESREALLREEMEFHMATMVEELVASGVPESEATARARQKFGNLTLKAEQSQETWIASWAADAAQDLRYALRGLLRQPAFALFAIAILSLGIGASTTVYSVLNRLVLQSLPVEKPEELVWIANSGQEGLSGSTIQVDHVRDSAASSKTLSSVGAYMAFYGIGETLHGQSDKPERITNVQVSCGFLPTLGVKPMLGRSFTEEECKWNAPTSVLLSNGYWRRRFASNPTVVGSQVIYNGKTATIIGVLPASFDFGAMFQPGVPVQSLSAFPMTPETNRWGNTLSVIGRMRPGVAPSAVQSELQALAVNFVKVRDRNGYKPVVAGLPEHVGGPSRMAVWIISVSVLVVMIIVCANLASLQLARAAARHKEFAIRTSLGAGRLRLIRQLLVESLLLSTVGCVLGVGLAYAGTEAIKRLDTIRVPMLSQVSLDTGVVAFAVLLAGLSGIFFGLLPAIQVGAGTVHDSLKESTRGGSSGMRQAWTRNSLVIGEVAFACVLLVCAGLLIRSMAALLDVHLGFEPARAYSMRINAKRNDVAETNEILRLAKEIPGIQAAGITDSMPFGKNRSWGIINATAARTRENFHDSFVRIVSDGFIPAMGIRLIEGRDFNERDLPDSPPVILINQDVASTFWPGQSAINKEVIAGGRTPRRVIGVVENMRQEAVEKDSGFEFYLSTRQMRDRNGVELIVRSSTPLLTLAPALKRALLAVDPSANATEIIEVQSLVDRATSPRRVLLLSLCGFALFALLLASLGIYALISYTVEQRRKEMGIKLALGASSAGLKTNILMHTLRLVMAGIVIGALGAIPVSRAMEGLLFGVKPEDPTSFLLAAVTFTLVALIAGYLPVRRISNIDPLEALRQDG